ncbi:hypothetical protein DSM43518_04258 [Mycobacterium marinum]|nr:hypothetical protein DSM43518_04258 [Mycobacterium marinum]
MKAESSAAGGPRPAGATRWASEPAATSNITVRTNATTALDDDFGTITIGNVPWSGYDEPLARCGWVKVSAKLVPVVSTKMCGG